ncbi:MAG: dTDP-4-dehydrorhamnose 3,5-epimerase [Lachnospiraceae bacterium]|nr:dTDP-4-dehydrorhamnose 3,5-epimerase [Lachnospiraceae bacterium]
MKVRKTSIEGLLVIEMVRHGDARGWFREDYNRERYSEAGITNVFVQDNHSFSAKKGTLRGLHYQADPMSQAKLVHCTRGSVIDVAVDLRQGSPTYLKYETILLTEDNDLQFYIPRGFAHGYLTLEDNTEFEYKVDNVYSPEHDRGIRYDDPDIGVDWGGLLKDITPVLSEKDINSPYLKDSDAAFVYGG